MLTATIPLTQPAPTLIAKEKPPPAPNISHLENAEAENVSISEAHRKDIKSDGLSKSFTSTNLNDTKLKHDHMSLIGKSHQLLHDLTSINTRGDEEVATTNANADIFTRSHAGRNFLHGAGTTSPASSVDITTQYVKTGSSPNRCTTKSTSIWPDNVLDIITYITQSESPQLHKSIFRFEVSTKAAVDNFTTLQQFDNFGEALLSDQRSFTKYGSEFKSTSILAQLLIKHPLWSRLSSILNNGIKFPMDDLDFTTRSFDLDTRLEFGNHKGASTHPMFYNDLNRSDILNGYAIPIPLHNIKDIPGALTCPMNVVEQMTISETGEIIEKQRACHDLSFKSLPSNTSVNSRINSDQLQDCMFGHCIIRVIHHIVALRYIHPNIPIMLQKSTGSQPTGEYIFIGKRQYNAVQCIIT